MKEKHWKKKKQKKQDNVKVQESMGFLGGPVVKNLPANSGDMVWSLSQEDPLEKEMANHSSILAWEIPQTEELGMLHTVYGVTKESDTT